MAHLLLVAALTFLLLTPAAAFATEAQDTLLAPGTLTLSEDPYSVEEPAPSEDEVATQEVSAPVQVSAPAVEPEPEPAVQSQPQAKDDQPVAVALKEESISTSPVPTVTEALATGEDPASTGLAPETDTTADPADKAAATAEPVVPQVAESPAEGASTPQDSIKKLAASAKDETAESTSAVATTTQSDTDPYEPNVVLVTPATMPDLTGAQALAARIGGVSLDATTFNASDGFLRLSITDGSSIDSAMARIAKVQGVLSAQPNFVYHPMANRDAYTSINDRWGASQWSLYFADVPLAWDSVRANHSVAVAIIDTGCQLDHPDLAANIVATYNSHSSSNTADDQMGHGTHVAGIVSGVANNSIGVAGVSYNANLVIIKASGQNEDAFDTASIARAYRWLESDDESGMTVAQHYNVRVVNMSIGGWDNEREANLRDDILHSAMLKARDQYGILTVVAASNKDDDEDPYFTYPGDSYACLEVMNLCEVYDDDGEFVDVELDSSSDYNVAGTTYKDLAAPGTSIHSTYTKSRYALDSGTSMAAPFVAGVAALVFAANPTLTPTQVQSILEATATDMGDPGWDEKYGYGAVNAADAVAMANTAAIQGWKAVAEWGTAGFSAELGLGQGTVDGNWTWSVVSDDDTGYATISKAGLLTGRGAGLVTVRATCTTTAGAQISQTMQVRVIDPQIQGAESVGEGETVALTTGADDLTWSWLVEDGTGHAIIDQEGHLTGVTAGTVTVRAICANNTDIVAEQTIDIAAALPLAA